MDMDGESVVVVFVTTPADDASRIAHHLVDNRLAACVNIVPEVRSVYRWEDNVEEDRECLLVIKTTKLMYETVSSAVREVHPYSVPEVIAVPVVDGYDGYLRWVRENVGKKEAPAEE
jgi:periplasmic divalent cation tolerance protein